MKKLAQIELSPDGGFDLPGKLGDGNAYTDFEAGVTAATLEGLISRVIGVMTVIAFIWFIFMFFTGALSWISAGGDAKRVESAQKRISTALVGLVVVVSAIFFIQLIGTILNIEILKIGDLFLSLI